LCLTVLGVSYWRKEHNVYRSNQREHDPSKKSFQLGIGSTLV
jgi:hypothetical protein